jgi:hypothetical protein
MRLSSVVLMHHVMTGGADQHFAIMTAANDRCGRHLGQLRRQVGEARLVALAHLLRLPTQQPCTITSLVSHGYGLLSM